MNNLHTIGPIYWVLKDNATSKTPKLAMAFMRQTGSPWRVGRGIQLKMNKYSFQIGLSKKAKTTDDLGELDGLLYAMQGRVMETSVLEIGDWQ
jgi:hypothetical protein